MLYKQFHDPNDVPMVNPSRPSWLIQHRRWCGLGGLVCGVVLAMVAVHTPNLLYNSLVLNCT